MTLTSLNRQRSDAPYDKVVLRFKRVATSDDPTLLTVTVLERPFFLEGGPFKLNRARLEEFRRILHDEVIGIHPFYRPDVPALPSQVALAQEGMARLGSELYELLPPILQAGFPALFQQVSEYGRGICLVLEVEAGEQADFLLSLPWELLAFRTTGLQPARSERFVIVRRLLNAPRRAPVVLTAPLDVLHVLSECPALPPLSPGLQTAERSAITAAIAPGRRYQVGEAEPGSVEAMMAALATHSCSVLHFLGHGGMTSANVMNSSFVSLTAASWLCFTSAAGKAQRVTGAHLQALLNSSPATQLIVLNACHGGAAVAPNVAFDLVRHGFPYVVAMQGEIHQAAAQAFITAFYQELQKSRSPEYAVAAGRSAIAQSCPTLLDWCLPVLYTNVGLPEKPKADKCIDETWRWFGHRATHHLSQAFLAIGAAGTITGILLFLSGGIVLIPDQWLIRTATVGLLAAPFALVTFIYRRIQPSLPPWPRAVAAAFGVELFGAASLTTGLFTCTLWFLLFLVGALGLWVQLAGWLRGGICALALLGVLGLSYVQTLWRARLLIAEPDAPHRTIRQPDLVLPVAGYILLLLPLVASHLWESFFTSPVSTILIGATFFVLGRALRPSVQESPPTSTEL